MNVKMNALNYATTKKHENSYVPSKTQEFKKVLNRHESQAQNSSNTNSSNTNSSNENIQKKYKPIENESKVDNKDVKSKDLKNDKVEKPAIEGNAPKDLNNSSDNVDSKTKLISLIEKAISKLKKSLEGSPSDTQSADKSEQQITELSQLLQLLSAMFQKVSEVSPASKVESEASSINIESIASLKQLIGENQLTQSPLTENQLTNKQLASAEKVTPDALSTIKNNLSEIVALLEKSKGDKIAPSEISNVMQKLTNVIEDLKMDLSLAKVPSSQTFSENSEDKSIKNTILKKVIELSTNTTSELVTKSQTESGANNSKESKFSGEGSSEEKFLNNLLGKDKDEIKISKAVNFMNQFETAKTIGASKVEAVNLVIDKNNFSTDIIKNVKFMEINNLKDLTVKMNPKDLGEITIKLTMESGIMKASISAQNKETYNLLNQNMQDISDKLKNMDIKIQSLDINIYEDSTFFNKDSNGRNNNGNKSTNSGSNNGLEEEDISISNNYSIEELQVNKFV